MTNPTCSECQLLRVVTGDSNKKGYTVEVNGRMQIELCELHSGEIADELAEALEAEHICSNLCAAFTGECEIGKLLSRYRKLKEESK